MEEALKFCQQLMKALQAKALELKNEISFEPDLTGKNIDKVKRQSVRRRLCKSQLQRLLLHMEYLRQEVLDQVVLQGRIAKCLDSENMLRNSLRVCIADSEPDRMHL